jgi:hypothetical protein
LTASAQAGADDDEAAAESEGVRKESRFRRAGMFIGGFGLSWFLMLLCGARA